MIKTSHKEKPLEVQGVVIYERPANLSSIKFRGYKNTVGAFSYANYDTIIYNCDIGRFTSIAHRVMIGPKEHPTDWLSTHGFAWNDKGVFSYSDDFMEILSEEKYSPKKLRTTIGNDVWIGSNAFIKRGVTIGNGAIIAAGSVVVNDIPEYCIVGGNPAKIIKLRFPTNLIEKLNTIQWWKYNLKKNIVGDIKYSNISESLDRISNLILLGKLERLEPLKIKISHNGNELEFNEV